ncbi:efflux RND transporter periplasmic adaptor subunit [Altererythrobacter salegens]|uniref:Efflux RND transporter periplasmic adaptor subunit n=1 Tax=Croceibacterium salegens TaxID=1737568 RepID=A0A6I4SXK0_9SPHN|nr:efflux RND transporter periplasmic adaptor subunit [Croceibacterium salegens]MXO60583.1 efflux RND transporter periplasmic adaptor subunit [Croceibacterium salegens]
MNYETTVNLDGSDGQTVLLDEAETEARRKKRVMIIAAIGAVLALVAYFAFATGGEEADFAPRTGQVPVVSVISPGKGTIEGIINATGTLAARRELPVGSVGEGGRVISVPVDAGQWVSAGQVLAVIDRSVQVQQTAGQAAQLQVAKADAELAQSNLDRALQLVERGFISKADIDRLTATRNAAIARVRVAEASLGERQARNAQLNIVAPAAGLLLERNVEPGQTVNSGSGVLFSIAKGGEMELLANLGESDLAVVSVGSPAQVTPAGTGKSFTGQIWQKAPVIDLQTRQGTARIALAYAPELHPGGFATTVIKSGTIVAPMLPESAIMSDAKGAYVFIVDKDNKVVRRAIKTGEVTARGIAVVEGITGDEKIVARAGGFLTEGETVKPTAVKN